MFKILFIFFCFPQVIISKQYPTISFISKDKLVDIGDDIKLVCTVEYERDNQVQWLKIDNKILLLSNGSKLLVDKNKYSLNYINNSTYILNIENINQTEAGLYQCQVIIGINLNVTAEVIVKIGGYSNSLKPGVFTLCSFIIVLYFCIYFEMY